MPAFGSAACGSALTLVSFFDALSELMARLKSFVFIVLYALTGVVCATLVHQILGADLVLSGLAGGAAFLTLGLFHTALARGADRSQFDLELIHLKQALAIVGGELEETQRQLSDLARTSETRAEARNKQIISEVRVLETLIEQMSDGMKEKASQLVEQVPSESTHVPGNETPPSRGPSVFEQLSQAELLDLVHGALDDNRVDVYLQPVVSLPQRKVRFYESFSHLRTADGHSIKPEDYIDVAEAAGLAPLIDNLLLFRCVQIVRRLSQREDECRIFCNISVHSLKDATFFPQFLEFLQGNQELARYLIFEFGQDVMNACGPMEKTNLRRLADLGFAYSLDKVTSLDMDLAELRDRKFRFIKVSGELLLSALPIPSAGEIDLSRHRERPPFQDFYRRAAEELDVVDVGGYSQDDVIDVFEEGYDDAGTDEGQLMTVPSIHAADFRELLDRYGIDLIVEKLETERDVVEVIDLDVDFGQGFVFGEPKPVTLTDLDTGPHYDEPDPERLSHSLSPLYQRAS